jgi:hypothetical protein
MNVTGCSVGYATDEMFRSNDAGACDVPLVAYYMYTLFIVCIKFVTAGRMSQNWLRRWRREPASKRSRMIPFAPVNMFFFAFVNLAIAVLGGLNLINFKNGLALMLYSVAFFPFAFAYTYGLIKLVGLGEKIIPKSHRQYADKTLASFDRFGKTLLVTQVVSFGISSLVLIIIGPILPEQEQLFLEMGFGLKSVFAALSSAGYVYQFERCIRVIRKVQASVKQMSTGPSDLESAVKRMRMTQLLHVLTAVPSVVPMVLLAASAVPASVWLTLIPAALEAIANLIYSFTLRGRQSQKDNQDPFIMPVDSPSSNSKSSKNAAPASSVAVVATEG